MRERATDRTIRSTPPGDPWQTSSQPRRASPAITITGRKLLVAALAVAMIAAACYIAFLAGQATRTTEADATQRTNTAVERGMQ